MNYSDEELIKDIERVNRISIVPTLLDVVCQTTGMGFAAIARVTETRWITCSVRDDIQFGLVQGSELKVETTICNEIRDSFQPVIINHVKENDLFCNHPTPLMYGFQSYISYPIILKTGEFFGTLCAIDPNPADLENPKIKGLFMAFSDLISFHLQQIELLDESDKTARNLNRQLSNSLDENRQYRHISSHTLQEPLRKLRIFSGMLVDSIRNKEIEKAEQFALKINDGADRFSNLIMSLSDFSILEENGATVQPVDLEYTVGVVKAELRFKLDERDATVNVGNLPTVPGVPLQMEQLFYHLFDNAVKFSKKDVPLLISISSQEYTRSVEGTHLMPEKRYVEIKFTDNGIGIDRFQLEKIFDMFSQIPSETVQEGSGIGLSICRKIIRNHSGLITIHSDQGAGTTVSIILPTS
ncbi:sensor histidine kinase [Persicitalea jodogahamensis]|uniref:histidine kinase n=1 Tax=Persicitalea jodogahamensis TaxID=402147 RepID=A0A8J3DBL9_9BACT|nr:ATP-binding protein [Persicitalea jodogahamensis]GHB79454.1 sensor histidine kinase [Persicitalea jodogahamensis]